MVLQSFWASFIHVITLFRYIHKGTILCNVSNSITSEYSGWISACNICWPYVMRCVCHCSASSVFAAALSKQSGKPYKFLGSLGITECKSWKPLVNRSKPMKLLQISKSGHHCNEILNFPGNPKSRILKVPRIMAIMPPEKFIENQWKYKFLGNLSFTQRESWTFPDNDPDKVDILQSGSANQWNFQEVYSTSRDHTTSWESQLHISKNLKPQVIHNTYLGWILVCNGITHLHKEILTGSWYAMKHSMVPQKSQTCRHGTRILRDSPQTPPWLEAATSQAKTCKTIGSPIPVTGGNLTSDTVG